MNMKEHLTKPRRTATDFLGSAPWANQYLNNKLII